MNKLNKNRTGAYITLIIALIGLGYASIFVTENRTPLLFINLAFALGMLAYLYHLNKEAKKLKQDREARKAK